MSADWSPFSVTDDRIGGKVRGWPRLVWDGINEVGDSIRATWKRRVVFAGLLVAVVALSPVVFLFLSWFFRPSRALRALRRRVEELWPLAPDDALTQLRTVCERLSQGGKIGAPSVGRRVRIEAFGVFHPNDWMHVSMALFAGDLELGYQEEALTLVSAHSHSHFGIRLKADWLVRMDRQSEAITFLEQNLHLDNWRGDLRQKLKDLAGAVERGLN